jgi:hypothetical protein
MFLNCKYKKKSFKITYVQLRFMLVSAGGTAAATSSASRFVRSPSSVRLAPLAFARLAPLAFARLAPRS